MNTRIALLAGAFLLLPVLAHASCDQVKASIDAKIKAKGVSRYSLDVVSGDQAGGDNATVVGTCEGGKKILYTRGAGSSDAAGSSDQPAAASSAPASSSSS